MIAELDLPTPVITPLREKEQLRLADFLPGVDRDTRVEIGRRRFYANRELIYSTGDPILGMYLLLKGRVARTFSSPNGRYLYSDIFRAPDVFGEPPTKLDSYGVHYETDKKGEVVGHETDMIAVGGSATVAIFDPTVCMKNTEVAFAVANLTAQRLIHELDSYGQTLRHVLPRLAWALLKLSEKDPESGLPTVSGLTQEDFGCYIGATRESAHYALGALANQEIIIGKPSIHTYSIANRQALRTLAGQRTE